MCDDREDRSEGLTGQDPATMDAQPRLCSRLYLSPFFFCLRGGVCGRPSGVHRRMRRKVEEDARANVGVYVMMYIGCRRCTAFSVDMYHCYYLYHRTWSVTPNRFWAWLLRGRWLVSKTRDSDIPAWSRKSLLPVWFPITGNCGKSHPRSWPGDTSKPS